MSSHLNKVFEIVPQELILGATFFIIDIIKCFKLKLVHSADDRTVYYVWNYLELLIAE